MIRVDYANLYVGLPMRRAILTEISEARQLRDERKRLLATATLEHDRLLMLAGQGNVDWFHQGQRAGWRQTIARREALLEATRAHLQSLMRLLKTLRGEA